MLAITSWILLLAFLLGATSLHQDSEAVQLQDEKFSPHQDKWKCNTITKARLDEWSCNTRFSSSTAMGGGARAIVKKLLSVETAEGVGARVRRSVGGAEVSRLADQSIKHQAPSQLPVFNGGRKTRLYSCSTSVNYCLRLKQHTSYSTYLLAFPLVEKS